jgi:hypothetical protein
LSWLGSIVSIWNLPLDVTITDESVNSISLSDVSVNNISTSSSAVYSVAITDSSRG